MATDPSDDLPGISRELADVLFRASLINAHREKQFDLSYGSTLLGFLASKAPLALWFQDFVEARRINVDEMMASHKVNREIVDEIARRAPGDLAEAQWRRTAPTKDLFDAANQLLRRVSRDATTALDERHVMAAYIYRSGREHQQELASWGFDLHDWSNAFLAELGLRNENELKHWLEIHQETFKAAPELPPELLASKPQSTPEQTREGSSQSDATAGQPHSANDQTQLLLDSPSTHDALGRKYFAETLAVRMNRAWKRYSETAAKGSFMLHIHGAESRRNAGRD